jgi:acyl dehydratase
MSTYLSKGGGSGNGGGKKGGAKKSDPPEPEATWDVPDDIGRRYARVSGDSNPIHLRRSTAMAFGMPRPIAHGMWTKARCLAALSGRLPEAYVVDVAFKLPIQLPAKVAFSSHEREFAVHDAPSGKPHIAGSFEPI